MLMAYVIVIVTHLLLDSRVGMLNITSNNHANIMKR